MPPAPTTQPCYVLGVGMTKFIKPRGKVDYTELGFESGIKALLDAGINYDEVDAGIACYCYGDSTCGQRVFYQFGMTQIPIVNVNNNCSTGSTGLFMARNMIAYGQANCVMVVGFEKMSPGSLGSVWNDRESPIMTSFAMMSEKVGVTAAPGAAQLFGNAGKEYIEKYGATADDLAEIARINHAHSVRNPYSQFQDVYTLSQIQASPAIHPPLTKLQCCPTSDGSAAAILVSESFLASHPALRAKHTAVRISGMALTTDSPALFSGSSMSLVGMGMASRAAKDALRQAGKTVDDMRIVELHDCFSANELITLDALGMSAPGKAHELVRAGHITYSKDDPRSAPRFVVNPSGGLISKGHPLGATGIAQCAELVWHLRGWATNRGVDGTNACLQHNLGLGGACVVSVYEREDGREAPKDTKDEDVAKVSGVGYNPAVVAGGFTEEMVKRARSRREQSAWAIGEVEGKVRARF